MREQTVTFSSGEVELDGVVASPDGDGPFPTALLIAGSGPLDRDGNHKQLALNISRDLARVLKDCGWASLRFDKRGVGESEGDYLSTGFFDELADVESAFGWLADQPVTGPVVAVGHSVGASMAVELAVRRPGLAGAVLFSFTAKTGEETLRWQTQQVKDHILPPVVKALLRLFRTDVVKQQAKAVEKLKSTTTDVARIQMVKTNAKWMREFIAYDPLPALRRVQVPVLAVTGTKDVQVDVADLLTIEALLPPGSRVQAVDDVDHLLRLETAPYSNPRLYRKQIQNPIDRRVTAALTNWLDGIIAHPNQVPQR